MYDEYFDVADDDDNEGSDDDDEDNNVINGVDNPDHHDDPDYDHDSIM